MRLPFRRKQPVGIVGNLPPCPAPAGHYKIYLLSKGEVMSEIGNITPPSSSRIQYTVPMKRKVDEVWLDWEPDDAA